jgi:hypothetical protein
VDDFFIEANGRSSRRPHKMTEFARVKGRRSGIRGKGRCLCKAANAVSIDYTTSLRGEAI